MTTSSEHEIGMTSEYADSRKKLKDECEQLWQQLQQVSRKLPKVSATSNSGERDGDSPTPLAAIYAAKKSSLLAQIHLLKEQQPYVLPLAVQCQQEILVEELENNILELKKVSLLIETQASSLKEACSRENVVLSEQEEIKKALEEKLNSQTEYSEDRERRELQKQRSELDNYYADIQLKMSDFVAAHFPKPTQEETVALKSKVSLDRHDILYLQSGSGLEIPDAEQIVSMQDMLEDLVNECLETAHDPYVRLSENHWAAYTEALLRCGIAIRHPDDVRRIKLTPFHL